MTKTSSKQLREKRIRRIIIFLLFFISLSIFPSPNAYFHPSTRKTGLFLAESFDLPKAPLIPIKTDNSEPLNVSAMGIYIIDLSSGVVLYERNAKDKFLPASTAKIATALVCLDHYKLDDILTVKTIISEGKTMGLVPNEKITVESLLYGILIHSANDAAYTVAENYPGGIKNFIVQMNRKVADLGLSDTHFTNSIGFDDPENFTTPKDLAKLSRVALTDKIFAKIVSTRSITVSDVNYTYFHELRNVNELLGKVAGVAGVKTGFTQNAGEILVSEVKKNGQELLFVVLKSRDRFNDTQNLIDWVFRVYIWQEIEKITPTVQG